MGYLGHIRKEFVRQCRECEMARRAQKLMKPMLEPVTLPRTLWEQIVINVKGPLYHGPLNIYW